MQKNLADIITEVSGAGATGILTLSMSNNTALFKIFFKKGAVYHITHGTCKDRECLVTMSALDFTQGSFLAGAYVDIKEITVIPHEDIMMAARNANKVITWAGKGDAGPGQNVNVDAQQASVDPAVIRRIGDELLNMVGPIAPMVLSNAYEACALKEGTTITKLDFQRLLLKISEQLPDEHKRTFMKQFVWQRGG